MILRYAGGREVTLRDLQAIGMTAGINALIVGNYLTTLGRSADEDLQMLEDLRMPIGALTPPSDRRDQGHVEYQMPAATHCTGCGKLLGECAGCGRELDPPRFCPSAAGA